MFGYEGGKSIDNYYCIHTYKNLHIQNVLINQTFLQECFNTPYGAKYFLKHAEPLHGHTTNLLSQIAKECQIYLVGGK